MSWVNLGLVIVLTAFALVVFLGIERGLAP
jgi:hypothetical protein